MRFMLPHVHVQFPMTDGLYTVWIFSGSVIMQKSCFDDLITRIMHTTNIAMT